MEIEDFEALVRDAIRQIPERFLKKLENVAFVVEPLQRVPLRVEHRIIRAGHLLGLYQGVPYGHRGPNYSGALPDKITLFQETIEAVAGGDPDQIRQIVQETVAHEVGHYFGMSEHAVRAWEHRKATRKKGHA